MKKLFYFFTVAAMALAVAACEKPDDEGGNNEPAAAPTADFDYAVDGLKVSFTDKSANATSYKWDFGDGESSKEASPRHEYASAGEYTVKLTVANADGVTAKKEATLTLAGAAKAYFTATPKTDRAGKFGKVVEFDATASENAKSISWNFGDGETGSDFKISHTFANYGTYTVKAEVTGLGGDKDVYEAKVEVIAYNEIIKGGSMEEEDAQYWTWVSADASLPDDGYSGTPGVPSFVVQFGYTEDGPTGGKDGCLRLGGENQYHDWAHNVTIYQPIEVVEGDVIQFSAQLKWDGNINDSGLFWMCIADEPTPADENIFVQFFNWWDSGVGNVSVPAYDGDLTGSANYSQGDQWGFSSPVDALGEGTGVCYTATKTGTVYVMFNVRNVWSFTYFGKDYFIDEVSGKIIL